MENDNHFVSSCSLSKLRLFNNEPSIYGDKTTAIYKDNQSNIESLIVGAGLPYEIEETLIQYLINKGTSKVSDLSWYHAEYGQVLEPALPCGKNYNEYCLWQFVRLYSIGDWSAAYEWIAEPHMHSSTNWAADALAGWWRLCELWRTISKFDMSKRYAGRVK